MIVCFPSKETCGAEVSLSLDGSPKKKVYEMLPFVPADLKGLITGVVPGEQTQMFASVQQLIVRLWLELLFKFSYGFSFFFF